MVSLSKIQNIYFFGLENKPKGKNLTDGHMLMKDLLGGKGAGLAEMCNLGFRVPPGFTITTQVCKSYNENNKKLPKDLMDDVKINIEKVESIMNKKFGDSNDGKSILLFSVRSGASVSMPGMMDTILNLGLNDKNVVLLAEATNTKFAYDSYRRLLQMFGDVVLNVDYSKFEKILSNAKAKQGVKLDKELSEESLKQIVSEYKKAIEESTKKPFPHDPYEQLQLAIEAVFNSWENERAIEYRRINKIHGLNGTAVNVQTMVFGNLNDDSGTGVAFSRSPDTGENKLYGEFLPNAQGEDVVAGVRTPYMIDEMERIFPDAYKEFISVYKTLEKTYRDMQDMEFTIQDKILYMLQCRNGKRSAKAAVKIAVDMVNEGLIDKKTAIARFECDHIEHLLHKQLDSNDKKNKKPIGKGLNASPGAAVGRIVLNNIQAVKMAKEGKVILVRGDTSPEDLIGMNVSDGILTSTGGKTSHAAVVARGMGRPCIASCTDLTIDEEKGIIHIGEKTFKVGDVITLDGTNGIIYEGEVKTIEPTLNDDFKTFMEWEKEFRTMEVRANVDSPHEGKKAIEFGASGIGLIRTERTFYEKSRILEVRKMILAKGEKEREEPLKKLKEFQKTDFVEIFKIMAGRPVCIRLLDPPLHEFLPKEKDQLEEISKKLGVSYEEVLEKLNTIKETNPMLGHRGTRVAVTFPDIIKMQCEAIFEASVEVSQNGHIPVVPEIMTPMIISSTELKYVKQIIKECADKILKPEYGIKYQIGTMIETPRAAITSGEIAKEAEFFSFGTNDLTQMTLGFSRDDSNKFLNDYINLGVFKVSPFVELDEDGVGFLVEKAVKDGKKSNPKIQIGICGETGGDPKSIHFYHKAGLDYVSCSPFRILVARLAAAQAAIKYGKITFKEEEKKFKIPKF